MNKAFHTISCGTLYFLEPGTGFHTRNRCNWQLNVAIQGAGMARPFPHFFTPSPAVRKGFVLK